MGLRFGYTAARYSAVKKATARSRQDLRENPEETIEAVVTVVPELITEAMASAVTDREDRVATDPKDKAVRADRTTEHPARKARPRRN